MGTTARNTHLGAAAGLLFLALVAIGACSDATSTTTTCNMPGYIMSCSCGPGHFGKQTCGNDQQFSPCDCPFQDGGGTTTGSGGSTNVGDAAGGDASTIATGVLLSSGPSRLIDLFVTGAGAIVVTADSIAVVDRAGMPLHMSSTPREITAAAFDGSILAVADKAILTTYSVELAPIGMATLTEGCVGLALLSGGRVMCAGQAMFPTKFYAFNATTGAALPITSFTSQVSGNVLRKVVGRDDLVAMQLSSSGFQLLRVDATSMVTNMGLSPFGHAYHVSPVFAFTGNPTDHIVTEDGIFANVYAPMCDTSFSTSAQCFVQDGALGTLRGAEKFIALDGAEGAGKVYALIDSPMSTFDTRHCVGGCAVERIDVTMRIAETKKSYGLDLGQVVAARHDATANALVVGYARPGASSSPTTPYPGFRVELLKYE